MMTGSANKDDKNMIPKVKKKAKELIKHGHKRIDNYYWLKDKKNKEVIEYLNDENRFLEKSLSHTQDIQNTIFEEITERIKPSDESVPYYDNGYYYYQRYEEGKEHPVYCRRFRDLTNSEEVLLDVNTLAEEHPNFHVSDISISDDNRIMAYSVDSVGNNSYTILFKDLSTGKILADKLINTDGDCEWASDSKTVFYVIKDKDTLREFQFWRHTIGTDYSKDTLVYEEKDERYYVSLTKSKSNKYILLGSYNTVSTEFRYLQANKPYSDLKLIQKREKDHEYYVETRGKELYILTNINGATNFKIAKTSIDNPGKQNWIDVTEHSEDILIEDFEVFKNYIVINERKKGLTFLRFLNLDNKTDHYLKLEEDVYEIWISDNNRYDTELLRYGYSSLTTPTSVFDYNFVTKERKLLKQKYTGNNFTKENYVTKRIFVNTEDSNKIPLSVVYKKGLKQNSNNPLLISAYGSYGISSDVGFQQEILSLLDRGFIYAIAHVRGGQEMGRKWYDNGKLLNKKNTFDDFIKCTKYLHNEAYSKPELTFAAGASAGGLLTGVVANSNPELYAGIVSEVPFVDVVTTMLDNSIPLTTGEYDEWGDPNQKKFYDYMLSYSPYDQIRKQKYPAMLITAGLEDAQVHFWEPAKWTVKLRDFNTGTNPVYLYTNLETGHFGYSGRYMVYKETALIYSFILDVLAEK